MDGKGEYSRRNGIMRAVDDEERTRDIKSIPRDDRSRHIQTVVKVRRSKQVFIFCYNKDNT